MAVNPTFCTVVIWVCGWLGIGYTWHKQRNKEKKELTLGCQVSSFRRLFVACAHRREKEKMGKKIKENQHRDFLYKPKSSSLTSDLVIILAWPTLTVKHIHLWWLITLEIQQLPSAQMCDQGLKCSSASGCCLERHGKGLIKPLWATAKKKKGISKVYFQWCLHQLQCMSADAVF